VLSEVHDEIRDLLSDKESITFKRLQGMKTLRNAVKESIRLYSPPIIVRGVRQNLQVGSFVVPKANFLCLSPFWSHRDPLLFEDPTSWSPSRFEV